MMIRTLRILIGFWISIPVIAIGLVIHFSKSCLNEYKGWLIDLKAMAKN